MGLLKLNMALITFVLGMGALTGAEVYVADRDSHSISVIDTATKKIILQIGLNTGSLTGMSPSSVAITPDCAEVYVSGRDSNSVSIINTLTKEVTQVDLRKGSLEGVCPMFLAVTPSGNEVYVANAVSDNVSIINTSTKEVSEVNLNTGAPQGKTPHFLVITPNGKEVYVANFVSNSLSVINTDTKEVTQVDLSIGSPKALQPFYLAITPDGREVYVANAFSNSVSVVNTATKQVTQVNINTGIVGGTGPESLAITPNSKEVYVGNFSSNSVSVINTDTKAVTQINLKIGSPPGIRPFHIAITPNGEEVYVAHQGDLGITTSGSVSVINTKTKKVTQIDTHNGMPEGIMPYFLAVTSDSKEVYVADFASNSISVIDTTTQSVISQINLTSQLPAGLGFGPTTIVIKQPSFPSFPDSTSIPHQSSPADIPHFFPVLADAPHFFLAITTSAPPPSSPQCVSGNQKKLRFATQSELYNTINWCPSSSSNVVKYNIYRNGSPIGSVPADAALSFEDHNRARKEKDVYAITAVNSSGTESQNITISLP